MERCEVKLGEYEYGGRKGVVKHKWDEREMSKEKNWNDRRGGAVCTGISMVVVIAGVTVLALWLVYRPEKPRLTVIGAAIYEVNMSSPALMSTSMQFSVVIKNPSRRASIYYDRLSAYVYYRKQAITPQLLLPPFYLHKHSSVSVAPLLGGTPLPVSLEVSDGFSVDQAYGVLPLSLIFHGRVRWIAGAIKTAHYPLYVNCDLLVAFKPGLLGHVPLLRVTPCHVHL
ncbi:hypothetical protein VNO78_18656 [Psophocarpus tetragonolobus]|uniref:Late embryogenesis abundant protein LEA-2 subgroup domain-containing protein n=1 Tax=Psophocarpus tetragonolobus TaxID=3891 RepID=A0AAN9XME2_PSOTE